MRLAGSIAAAVAPYDKLQWLLAAITLAGVLAFAVGITVEPDGGSKQPSSEPIALFDLTEAT